jgi:protein MAK16
MQHDEVIWQVVNQNFCSYKSKQQSQNFCRNKHNVTGLCNRSSCPLANSRYATIVEEKGVCYLYMKTIERAHTPNRMWERVKLSANYGQALAAIDEQLEHWPKFLIHKCKQRMTKITQYLIRMRKLKLKVRPKLVGIHKKVERREARREAKAEAAAKVEKSIERELLARLKQGTYGDIYNFPVKEYQTALDEEELEQEDADIQQALDGAEAREGAVQFVEDGPEFGDDFDMEDFDGMDGIDDDGDTDSSDEDDGDSSDSDMDEAPKKRPKKPKKVAPKLSGKGGRKELEIEYEEEREAAASEQVPTW